jgi:branched-subunit amino acid ABC-type transport system permease component
MLIAILNPTPFIVSGLVTGSVYGMSAMGIVFTYKVSRVVNFAYGAVAMFCAYCRWGRRIPSTSGPQTTWSTRFAS